MTKVTAASVDFDLKALSTPKDFWNRVEDLTARAARGGAQLVLFPEYFSLSWLLSLNGGDFEKALDGFAARAEEFHHEMSTLAHGHGLCVVAGSQPVVVDKQRRNRSFIYFPDGAHLFHDKRHMTRFEDEEWMVAGSTGAQSAFEWAGARWGLAICYDVEFPQTVAELIHDDADILLVPSCTDDLHGYWRVRHCAQARAVEGQCGVVMSSIVGGDPRHPEIYPHFGQAGFFTPCDLGFPEQGVLALGEPNRENVTIATFDIERIREIRVNGTVLNRRDQAAGIL